MFRCMSRVAVVAIVLLFTFSAVSVPAFAVPQGGGKTAEKTESGWIDAAIAWFSQLVSGDTGAGSTGPAKKVNPNTGPCVDPFGRCG